MPNAQLCGDYVAQPDSSSSLFSVANLVALFSLANLDTLFSLAKKFKNLFTVFLVLKMQ